MTLSRVYPIGAAKLDDLADVVLTAGGSRGEILAHDGTAFRDRSGSAVDARDHGAKGDGTTDDSAAIGGGLIPAIAAGSGVLTAGTYALANATYLMNASYATVRGAGMWQTSLKWTGAAGGSMIQVNQQREQIVFEDIGFDGNGTAANLIGSVDGNNVRRVVFRRCRFTNFTALGINATRGAQQLVVEDCFFHQPASLAGTGTACQVGSGIFRLTWRRNRVVWCKDGLIVDTGSNVSTYDNFAQGLDIDDNEIDLYWWLLPSQASNSGGTVTYSATGLTDTAANFGSVTNLDVRAMAVLRTGTATALPNNGELQDAGATFVTAGVRRGHLVRSGTKFAVVLEVQSETVLRLEEWLDNTSLLPTQPPANGAAYTVYGIVIGQISAKTATTLTVARWFDLDGVASTPASGTRYEIQRARCNYPIQVESQAANVNVRRNRIRRGWSDLVSIFGFKATVISNTLEDGQDTGITLNAGYTYLLGDSLVAHNRIRHLGAQGMAVSANDATIHDNIVSETQWVNGATATFVADITLYSGSVANGGHRQWVHHNICDGKGKAHALRGIGIDCRTSTMDGLRIEANRVRGHATAGITFYNTGGTANIGPTNAELVNNDLDGEAVAKYEYAGTPVTPLIVASGTGSPEGVLRAAIGSHWRRKDGGAGTSFYVKESGAGNTGWRAV